MVRIFLKESGQELEIQDGQLTFVKQVNDIGEVTNLKTSFTWSMKFPKTHHNTMILAGLGLSGDDSRMPYQTLKCAIIENGATIVSDGNLEITETSDSYKMNVKEGIIDFIKSVNNETITDAIPDDLASLDHINDEQTIKDSWNRNDYRYIVADYSGPFFENFNNTTRLNAFTLVPSVNLNWLWTKLFDHYGWTWGGDLDLTNKWMTYPFALPFNEENTPVISGSTQGEVEIPWASDELYLNAIYENQQQDIVFAEWDGNDVVINRDGNYRVQIDFRGLQKYFDFDAQLPDFYSSIRVYVYLDDEVFFSVGTIDYPIYYPPTLQRDKTDFLYAGNRIRIAYKGIPEFAGYPQSLIQNYSILTIYRFGTTETDFREAFVKFKVKDFFKEIMVRNGLVAYTDSQAKHIEFQSFENRINNPVINFSSLYAGRVSERYVYRNYAQNNFLKHKQNNEANNYFEGNLTIENENLPIESTLFESLTYAPDKDGSPFKDQGEDYYLPRLPMYELEIRKEVDNNGDEQILGNYKPLEDRFYIIENEFIDRHLYLGQANPPELITRFPRAVITNDVFSKISGSVYKNIKTILDSTRIHTIKMAFTNWDASIFRFDRVIWLEQENAYYLPNRMTYKPGELTTLELIKLRPAVDWNPPIIKPPNPLLKDITTIYQFINNLDDSGGGNLPLTNGVGNYVQGINGLCLSVGGDATHVCWRNYNAFTDFGNGPFTIQLWFKRTGSTGGIQYMVSEQSSNSVLNWRIYFNGTDLIFETFSGRQQDKIMMDFRFNAGAGWHHLIIQGEGTDPNDFEMYIDAVKKNTNNAMSGNYVGQTDQPIFVVGGRQTDGQGTDFAFFGDLDEIYCWKRKLPLSEIQELYKNGVGYFYPFL